MVEKKKNWWDDSHGCRVSHRSWYRYSVDEDLETGAAVTAVRKSIVTLCTCVSSYIYSFIKCVYMPTFFSFSQRMTKKKEERNKFVLSFKGSGLHDLVTDLSNKLLFFYWKNNNVFKNNVTYKSLWICPRLYSKVTFCNHLNWLEIYVEATLNQLNLLEFI